MINKKHIIFLTLIVACFLVSPAYAEVNQPIALQETTQDLSGEGWNWDASKRF